MVFDHYNDDLSPLPGQPVPVMAMFAGGRVSEMEASLSDASGGRAEEGWRVLVAAQLPALRRRVKAEPMREEEEDTLAASGLGSAQAWRYVRPDGALRLRA